MAKMSAKEIAAANAYCAGEEDYPRRDLCPYNPAKEPHAHDAYWAGWNQAATQADRDENSHGSAKFY